MQLVIVTLFCFLNMHVYNHKALPESVAECSELKQLDVSQTKKPVCKITPEMLQAFKFQRCRVQGVVVKKAKGKKKK